MELELRSAQEEAQRQERNIQNITDTVNSKEAQVLRDEQRERGTERLIDRLIG